MINEFKKLHTENQDIDKIQEYIRELFSQSRNSLLTLQSNINNVSETVDGIDLTSIQSQIDTINTTLTALDTSFTTAGDITTTAGDIIATLGDLQAVNAILSGDLQAVDGDFSGNVTSSTGYVQGQFKQEVVYNAGASALEWFYYSFPSNVSKVDLEVTGAGGGGGGTETTNSSQFCESAGGGGGAYFLKRLNKSDCTFDNEDFSSGDVNTGSDEITVTGHSYVEGLPVRFTTTGTLPAPLAVDTTYYLSVSGNDLQVHTTQGGGTNNAMTSPINLTNGGSGTHTIVPQEAFISGIVGKGGAAGQGDTTTPTSGSDGDSSTIYTKDIEISAGPGEGGSRDFATTGASYVAGGDGGSVTETAGTADRIVNGEMGGYGSMPVGGIRLRSYYGGGSFYGTRTLFQVTDISYNGNFPGGGGSGNSIANSTSGNDGGDGADGEVLILEYY